MPMLKYVAGGMIDCPLHRNTGHLARVVGHRIRPVPDPSGDPSLTKGELFTAVQCPETNGVRWLNGKTQVRVP